MDRERIVEFLRRYWREVLAVAGAVLLLDLLGLRVLRGLRLLAAPVLIGAILIVGWLLLGPVGTQPSADRNEFVRACGREVLPEYPLSVRKDFARGMRLDCGIYGPSGVH